MPIVPWVPGRFRNDVPARTYEDLDDSIQGQFLKAAVGPYIQTKTSIDNLKIASIALFFEGYE